MSTKRRWYELLLPGLVILLVLAAGMVKTANAYDYVASNWEGDEYASEYIWDWDSTWEVYEDASSSADEGTLECECTVDVHAYAKDDYAVADVDSYALLLRDWTWNGPPESTAPGGDLTWTHVASGSSTVAWGDNEESATSSSSAEAGSWSSGTEGSAYADVEAWGYITDGTTFNGGCETDANPPGSFDEGDVGSYTTHPAYSFWIDGWSFETGNTEVIDSGTTYIQFYGGIDCEAYAVTTNTGTTYWSHAGAEASAEVQVSAVFEPNE